MPRVSLRHPLHLLAAVSDLSGRRQPASRFKHNGRYIFTGGAIDLLYDEPTSESDRDSCDAARAAARRRQFDVFAQSGRFSETELRTIRALAFEHLTVAQFAQLDGCSRQAVLARVHGNSRHQGGLLKKVVSLYRTTRATAGDGHAPHAGLLAIDPER